MATFYAALVTFAFGMAAAPAYPAPPDPCALISRPELEAIAGKVVRGPTHVDDGTAEASCEYTLATGSYVEIGFFRADAETFERNRKSFGGKGYAPAPDFGKDAFVNSAYMDNSAELFVMRGGLVLRVSTRPGPNAVTQITAVAKVALPRLQAR